MGSRSYSPFSHEGGLVSILDGRREICGGQSGTWTGFHQVLRFRPVSIISNTTPHLPESTRCSYESDKQGKPGNIP